jgi:hypothetical protein
MGISAGIKNVVGAVKSKGIQLIDNFAGYATRSEGSIPNPTGMIDDVVNKVDDLADDIGTVKVGTKAATEGGVKTDFYVTPSGTAVPSTGQRYFARNPELLQSAKDGVLPARSNGMYFSFDKIDDAIIAQGKLQIPYRPEYRVSFDTLQIIDDIKVPNGDWGRASYLEPLTKDFMQYGPGKATQAITNSPVNISEIYKLR